MSSNPRLSLGPNLFYWSRDDIFDFYAEVAEMPVDIVYLGETVCSKRRSLRTEDWFDLADRLSSAGKEVVLSTLSLLEAESEMLTLRRLCENDRFMVEANDMGAVQLLIKQDVPFVTGPTVNIYNPATLQVLANKGLKRWVMPIELSKETLAEMQAERPEGVETEIFAFGRMPLTLSARCFTARSHNLPKDDCQYKCLDYPDGRLLSTQEKKPFLALNGIQTVSSLTCNLLAETAEMKRLDVDVLRISPQSQHTGRIAEAFHQALQDEPPPPLDRYVPLGTCDGYWYGGAGMERLKG